jgi:hypothetical protein
MFVRQQRDRQVERQTTKVIHYIIDLAPKLLLY